MLFHPRPSSPASPQSWTLEAYRPGALAAVTGAHARWYADHWGLGAPFECKVAGDMAAFLSRWTPERDLFLTAWSGPEAERRFLGSVTLDGIDADGKGAHLRWFIVMPEARGLGLGGHLLDQALAFADQRNYARQYLWTFEGLEAARHLYEARGFALVESKRATTWGRALTEQRLERRRPSP
ncbi:MAG: GNAT family N-acetyltransferase [Rhodospirillum sp.]|nr:GNAT family N-acetyltransferase [Rhodospirillum sp.]MCF8490833.1 GNAT family N-acetyltransferase [Rhodospirillum sp.]MCF8501392.1 GNAT family N-acetyltransferase [Rhodospirillum sp.]